MQQCAGPRLLRHRGDDLATARWHLAARNLPFVLPHRNMRAWTIQTPNVAETLHAGRTWRADERRTAQDWRPAYRWMRKQMISRLGEPSIAAQSPVWVWQQWRGRDRARPDLRCSGHLPRGARGVRIELEIEPERLVLSDFELWHYVLNGWYLPRSMRDERKHEDTVDRRLIEQSWDRIFDLDWSHPRFTGPVHARTVQGTTWELRPADVRRIDTFVAR